MKNLCLAIIFFFFASTKCGIALIEPESVKVSLHNKMYNLIKHSGNGELNPYYELNVNLESILGQITDCKSEERDGETIEKLSFMSDGGQEVLELIRCVTSKS